MAASIRSLLGAALLAAVLPAQAIVGGSSTPDFKDVGGNPGGGLGSGVQITDQWVLTARHVGWNVGTSFSNGYGSTTVAERFNLGPGPFPANDLALLRLAAPLGGGGVSLLNFVIPAGELLVPLPVTIATGLNHSSGSYAGTRGYGATFLGEVWNSADPDGSGPLPPVPVNWLIAYTPTFGQPYVQGGDSGGGLFLRHVTDSVSPLMGITSAFISANPPSGPLYASGFVQIAAYRSWIDSTITSAGFAAPLWITPVPEPASYAMMAFGLLLVVALVRPRVQRRRYGDGSLPA